MKRFAGFTLDISNQCLWQNGSQLALPPKPFAVLRYLTENPGRLITHDELLEALWPDTYVQPQVLRTYMLELRKLLGDDARQPRFIQSLPKRGYCFVAPVSDGAPAGNGNGVNGHHKTTALVGRGKEIESLGALLAQARDKRRQIVFLTGDSGIGKTALLDCFCQCLDSSTPVTIARGQCVQGVAHREEYYPVMEALAGLCASEDGEHVCAILARLAPAWLSALGRQAGSPAAVRGPGELCAALEEIAAVRPLMLVFEDLHWADESTLGLISALARRRAAAGILLIASVNPQHAANAHPLRVLKQDLGLRSQCTEILLEPLGKAEVRELLAATLAQPTPPADLDGFVLRHSEGNPMFALALVKHLIAQEMLVRRNSGTDHFWELAAPVDKLEPAVPDELAQMIELDVQALAPADQRLLEAASLFTVAFPAWGVAAALDEDPAAIEESCDTLARRLFFVRRAGYDELPGGAQSAFYVFGHGLYREVLYQRQAPARRAERHNRIAQRLAKLFAGREAHVAREMAAHFEAASNWMPAVRALQAAAQQAASRQSHRVAGELLRDALRLASNLGPQDRAEVEREVGPLLSVDTPSTAVRH
jgi:predicted ATPase/DNA-binding winged helix-turn-helix (wHTH) protein